MQVDIKMMRDYNFGRYIFFADGGNEDEEDCAV